MLRGYIVFVFSVCLWVNIFFSVCLWVNIYFVSKISQELLYLESWNFVHMTSMTSCIVGKKIGAVGSGHVVLFPFVVLANAKTLKPCYHWWPWPGVLVSICSLHGLVYYQIMVPFGYTINKIVCFHTDFALKWNYASASMRVIKTLKSFL